MASNAPERSDLARRIEAARVEEDRSVAWLARRAGISPTALRQKLAGNVDFYMWEVARIARALGHRMSDLLPEEWARPEQTRATKVA